MYLLAPLLLLLIHGCSASVTIKNYVVYMGSSLGKDESQIRKEHEAILNKVTGSTEELIYSYCYGFSGFAARLTNLQADYLSYFSEVVHLEESRNRQLSTTRSWEFLNALALGQVPSYYPNNANPGSDVIIGIIDTGIWPESASFAQRQTTGAVPARWKGACVNPEGTKAADRIDCNRKLIGSRFYHAGEYLPEEPYGNGRDSHGHGTHSCSTAAGNAVPKVNVSGLARGTAKGGLPSARLASYKVCWSQGCAEMDVLAAFDDAIRDGVDIISMSIGDHRAATDIVAIAAYHATERGIVVVAAGGNDGPSPGTLSNIAPWMVTVGASSIDREIDVDNGVYTAPYEPAPVVPDFSSRGPSKILKDIIKPDLSAPGVDIVSAWPSNLPVVDIPFSSQKYYNYSIMSGTSVACPHVAGAVAYIRTVHPDWSPAALKSALMTTASVVDNTNGRIQDFTGQEADWFSLGAGVIQPLRGVDPGLVYDLDVSDYIGYICLSGYTTEQMRLITGNASVQCPVHNGGGIFNYPTIGWNRLSGSKEVSRTVTNVGPPATYVVSVVPIEGLDIVVEPSSLVFTETGQKRTYTVRMSTATNSSNNKDPVWSFTSLSWTDGKHVVRSNIAVSV